MTPVAQDFHKKWVYSWRISFKSMTPVAEDFHKKWVYPWRISQKKHLPLKNSMKSLFTPEEFH